MGTRYFASVARNRWTESRIGANHRRAQLESDEEARHLSSIFSEYCEAGGHGKVSIDPQFRAFIERVDHGMPLHGIDPGIVRHAAARNPPGRVERVFRCQACAVP